MIWWPLIGPRLVQLLPTLPGWSGVEIYDGPPVTGSAPDTYFTVGYVVGEDFAGSFERTRSGDVQGMPEENGTLRSELVCSTGAVDLASVRSRGFALLAELEAQVASDERLGILPSASATSVAVDVEPAQTTDGASQRLIVTLTYVARG